VCDWYATGVQLVRGWCAKHKIKYDIVFFRKVHIFSTYLKMYTPGTECVVLPGHSAVILVNCTLLFWAFGEHWKNWFSAMRYLIFLLDSESEACNQEIENHTGWRGFKMNRYHLNLIESSIHIYFTILSTQQITINCQI
jgi:hypothetical protein